MNDTDFLQRLQGDIERNGLFSPGAKIVVGVSGGVDSVVLLHALNALRESLAFELHVAHLNHGLRGIESDADADFVKAFAEQRHLPITLERVELNVEQPRSSPEDVARRARFSFFERVCAAEAGTHVALGHHADDQAETVLHRLVRGTGIRGLSGMTVKRRLNPSSSVMLIKPLLGFSRGEIAAYAETQTLEYREDASNASPDHTRNRIRHDLVPLLERSFNPQIRDAVLRLAEQSRWTHDFVSEAAATALDKVVVDRTDSAVSLDRIQFVKLPTIIQASLVRLVLAQLGTRERRLTFRHITDILDGVSASNAIGRFTLPDSVDVQFDRTEIRLSRQTTQPNANDESDMR